MNNNIAVPDRASWPIAPYVPGHSDPLPGRRSYSAASILDFATFVRILQHWRWTITGVAVAGLVLAISASLLTTPAYRAWVTLEWQAPK